MGPSTKDAWPQRAEKFARIRAQILQVLTGAHRPLDMAQLMSRFKHTFRYLPYLERRIYELLEQDLIEKIPGPIPRYQAKEEEP